jgi:hypothetical protein
MNSRRLIRDTKYPLQRRAMNLAAVASFRTRRLRLCVQNPPISRHFKRRLLRYALETDWLAGAGDSNICISESEVAKAVSRGGRIRTCASRLNVVVRTALPKIVSDDHRHRRISFHRPPQPGSPSRMPNEPNCVRQTAILSVLRCLPVYGNVRHGGASVVHRLGEGLGDWTLSISDRHKSKNARRAMRIIGSVELGMFRAT